VVDHGDAEQLATTIIQFSNMSPNEYEQYCQNAVKAAADYDYHRLTEKLIELI
jgi:hypothetical protein